MSPVTCAFVALLVSATALAQPTASVPPPAQAASLATPAPSGPSPELSAHFAVSGALMGLGIATLIGGGIAALGSSLGCFTGCSGRDNTAVYALLATGAALAGVGLVWLITAAFVDRLSSPEPIAFDVGASPQAAWLQVSAAF